MDWAYLLSAGGIGLISFTAAIVIVVAGAGRLAGRRSRLDRAADVTSHAASMAVFPPSLRGRGAVVPPRPDRIGRPVGGRSRRMARPKN